MKRLLAILLTLWLAACGNPADRAGRFWDGTDFGDPALTQQADAVDERFAEYLDLLGQMPVTASGPLLQVTLDRAETNSEVFQMFWDLCEKYLYSPESPCRDEELYRYALQTIVASDRLDDYTKLRPRYQLNMIARNRIGEQATDIEFTLANGERSSLHAVEAEYTILYFNNPDCPACDQMRAELAEDRTIGRLMAANRLRVVALYTSPDEDEALWRRSLADYPADWIAAYDQGAEIHYKGLYDLRSIPCLYLLDSGKRVLYKGAIATEPIVNALKEAVWP